MRFGFCDIGSTKCCDLVTDVRKLSRFGTATSGAADVAVMCPGCANAVPVGANKAVPALKRALLMSDSVRFEPCHFCLGGAQGFGRSHSGTSLLRSLSYRSDHP